MSNTAQLLGEKAKYSDCRNLILILGPGTPEVVLVILEGDQDVCTVATLGSSQPTFGLQDNVLGEGDVEATVTLDTNWPRVVGEGKAHTIFAQLISVGVRDVPDWDQMNSVMQVIKKAGCQTCKPARAIKEQATLATSLGLNQSRPVVH